MAYGGDLWLKDYEKAVKLAQKLKLDAQRGESGGRAAALMHGQISALAQDIRHLESSLMSQSDNPASYNVTRAELTRRGDLLAELQRSVERVKEDMRSGVRARCEQMRQMPSPREDTDTGDRFGHNATILAQQDQQIDFLEGSVGNLKNLGLGINSEIDVQLRLLGDLEEGTDKAALKMHSTQNMLVNMMNETSETCLWCTIIFLIVLIVVLLIVL